MAEKYEVVCTNPPYMGGSGMDKDLSIYVKKNYPDSKSDLFAAFIEKCLQLTKQNCYTSMVTMQSWMFLSSFEKLREKLLLTDTVNMAHLGARAFDEIGGEVVQTTSFVLRKSHTENYNGTYCRLIEPKTQKGKENMFLSCENRYIAQQENFSKIPGSPIAYWVSDSVLKAFKIGIIFKDFASPKQGIKTANKDKFLRLWYEVSNKRMSVCEDGYEKWFPCNKGGNFRKWYGNNEYVVNWENDGYEICNYRDENGKLKSRPQNLSYMLKEGLTYTNISSSTFGVRYSPSGFIYDAAGSLIYVNQEKLFYTLGLLATKVVLSFTSILSPTMSFEVGQIAAIPVIYKPNESINYIVENNIALSKTDWDSFETSWDFQLHPLVQNCHGVKNSDGAEHAYIEDAYNEWESDCLDRFNRLKANEEELNRIFIDIYGLQDELTPDVEDKDITVRKADLQRDIKSLISYAVGCMFGRYSLDRNGIVFAGGNFNDVFIEDALYPSDTLYPSDNLFPKEPEYSKLKTDDGEIDLSFYPDYDNCIPITDTAYFEDDIVGRFCEFVKVVYGEDTLEANLEFIAKALGNKGNTSRDIIRNYFLNDFFKDHCKVYQKRPIYWLFDSGKQNGFKALVYMHRWNADTIGNMRVEYLHRIQRTYEKEIEREQDTIDNTTNNRDRAAATKRKEKLLKQLKEAKDYDAKVAHLALSRPDIDLDDGVKVNYEKVQTAQDGKKLQILAKI